MESAGLGTPMPLRINEVAVAFPPHRRSPLKSKTLEIFARILSLYDDKSHNNADLQIISENPKSGDQCKEPDVMTQEGLQGGNLLAENDMVTSDIQNEALNSSEILHELEHMAGIEESGEQRFDPLTEEKYLTIVNELEKSVLPELDQEAQALMDGKVDKSKDRNSCSEMDLGDHMEHERWQVDTDTLVDSSSMPLDQKETEEGEILDGGVISQSEDSFFKDSLALEERNADGAKIERERQQIERDVLANRSSSALNDQDTEEGEILDGGINSGSGYLFLEDPIVTAEKKMYEERIPGNHPRQEVFEETCCGKKVGANEVASMPDLVETIDSVSNCTKDQAELRESVGMEGKGTTRSGSKTWNVKEPFRGADGKEVNGFKGSSNFLLDDPMALSHSGESEAATENKKSTSTEKVKAGDKRKRSNTAERKARKKLRERKKRAEKNRQLGVKRLKLQPITKPKPVRYCDFYLKGRCQQGNSCKFSHDTTPLTKSQPCKFLALNSCLKGDDCPFDHQLSKYACDRYKANGFCNRGDKCLFSHEIKSVESSNLASTSGQKEPEASSLQPCVDPRRPLQNNLSLQTLKNVKETSARTPVAEAWLKTKVQTAKGTDIIGKRQLSNSSQSLQILKTTREKTSTTPSSIDNLIHRDQGKDVTNSGLKQPMTQTPKGITFLSFGKPLFNDTGKQMQGSSPPGREGSEMHNGNNQSESEKSQNPNEKPCKTPASPFSSFCQSPKCGTSEKPHNSNVPPLKTPPSQLCFRGFPRAVAESQNKNPPTSSSAQKALLSTMAFASKYQAEMIDKSIQSSLSNDKNNGAMSGNSQSSRSVQKGSMTASKILQEFLFGGSDNVKT